MNIQTVKRLQHGGYLVNGELYVPEAPGNGHYHLVQEWIAAGNTPEPWETDAERLTRLAREKRAEVEQEFTAAAAQIKAGYSADEVLSWDKQIQEAKAYKGDPQAATPLLDGILTERSSDTKDSLVASILSKADAYAVALGPAMGRKQQRTKDLEAIDLTSDPDAEAKIGAV